MNLYQKTALTGISSLFYWTKQMMATATSSNKWDLDDLDDDIEQSKIEILSGGPDSGGEVIGSMMANCSDRTLIIKLSKLINMKQFFISAGTYESKAFPESCIPQELLEKKCEPSVNLGNQTCDTVADFTYDYKNPNLMDVIVSNIVHVFDLGTTESSEFLTIDPNVKYAPIIGTEMARCIIDEYYSPIYELPMICGNFFKALIKGSKFLVFSGVEGCIPWKDLGCGNYFNHHECESVISVDNDSYQENTLTGTIKIDTAGVALIVNNFCQNITDYPTISPATTTTVLDTSTNNDLLEYYSGEDYINKENTAINALNVVSTAVTNIIKDLNNSRELIAENQDIREDHTIFYVVASTMGAIVFFACSFFIGVWWWNNSGRDEMDGEAKRGDIEEHEMEISDPEPTFLGHYQSVATQDRFVNASEIVIFGAKSPESTKLFSGGEVEVTGNSLV